MGAHTYGNNSSHCDSQARLCGCVIVAIIIICLSAGHKVRLSSGNTAQTGVFVGLGTLDQVYETASAGNKIVIPAIYY